MTRASSILHQNSIYSFYQLPYKEQGDHFSGVHSAMEHSEKITYGHVKLDEGMVVPIHNHIHEQWTYIMEGQMEFTLDGEKQLLLPGMGAYIPSNVLHGALADKACTVIDVFTPVREDYRELGIRNWELVI